MICLLIDTSNNQKVSVGLRIDEKEYKIEQEVDKSRKQPVLSLLDKILKEHKLELTDFTAIEVNTGPGSFTGVRVGVSVANALSYALKIPVNGKKIGELARPVYS